MYQFPFTNREFQYVISRSGSDEKSQQFSILILPSLFVNVSNGPQLGKDKKYQENMEISRIHFWGIDSVALFYVLAGISVIIFLIGVYFRVSIWLAGIKRDTLDLSIAGITNLLKDGLLGRRIFKGDLSAGLMHFFIMWGFIGLFAGTVLLTIDYWLIRFLTDRKSTRLNSSHGYISYAVFCL